MAKFNKNLYMDASKKAEKYLELTELLEKHNSKDPNEQLSMDQSNGLMADLNKQLGYDSNPRLKAAAEKLLEQDPTGKKLVAEQEKDLQDLLYDTESEIQQHYVKVFPDVLSEQYKRIIKDIDQMAGEQVYTQYKGMARALEYMGLEIKKAPEAIQKVIDADKKNDEIDNALKEEIIDAVINKEMDDEYKSKDGSYTINESSMNAKKKFEKKRLKRLFSFTRKDILGEYMKQHANEMVEYIEEGAKMLVNYKDKDDLTAGKMRLEGVNAYQAIMEYSIDKERKTLRDIEKASYKEMGLKEK